MKHAVAFLVFLLAFGLAAGAGDLGQGHHLWSVKAPNGTQSFIAAASSSAHPDVLALLKRQLQAASSVKRVATVSQHHDVTMRTDEWSRVAQDSLSEDLLSLLETELAPVLRAGFNAPPKAVRSMKLESLRVLLTASPRDFYAKGHSPIEQTLSEFQRERGGALILRPKTQGELTAAIARARAADPRSPAEIIQAVLDDRRERGLVSDRVRKAFLSGDWKELNALDAHASLAYLGVRVETLNQLDPASEEALADQAFSALSDAPTLLMVQGHRLAGANDLLSLLERKGFEVRPVSLDGSGPKVSPGSEPTRRL